MKGLTFNVKSNMKQVLRELGEHPKIVQAAAVSALNRAALRASVEVRRALAKEFYVPQRVARGRVSKFNAKRTSLVSGVYVRVKPVFPASIGAVRQTKKGARVGRHFFAGAFSLAPGHVSEASGKTYPRGIILQRKGAERLPVEAPTIKLWPRAGEISQREVARVSSLEVEKRFRHEYERRLKRVLA